MPCRTARPGSPPLGTGLIRWLFMGLLGSHLVVLGGGARGSTKETIRIPPWGPQEPPYVVVSMMAECGGIGGPAVPPGRGQPRRAPQDPGPHVRSLGAF